MDNESKLGNAMSFENVKHESGGVHNQRRNEMNSSENNTTMVGSIDSGNQVPETCNNNSLDLFAQCQNYIDVINVATEYQQAIKEELRKFCKLQRAIAQKKNNQVERLNKLVDSKNTKCQNSPSWVLGAIQSMVDLLTQQAKAHCSITETLGKQTTRIQTFLESHQQAMNSIIQDTNSSPHSSHPSSQSPDMPAGSKDMILTGRPSINILSPRQRSPRKNTTDNKKRGSAAAVEGSLGSHVNEPRQQQQQQQQQHHHQEQQQQHHHQQQQELHLNLLKALPPPPISRRRYQQQILQQQMQLWRWPEADVDLEKEGNNSNFYSMNDFLGATLVYEKVRKDRMRLANRVEYLNMQHDTIVAQLEEAKTVMTNIQDVNSGKLWSWATQSKLGDIRGRREFLKNQKDQIKEELNQAQQAMQVFEHKHKREMEHVLIVFDSTKNRYERSLKQSLSILRTAIMFEDGSFFADGNYTGIGMWESFVNDTKQSGCSDLQTNNGCFKPSTQEGKADDQMCQRTAEDMSKNHHFLRRKQRDMADIPSSSVDPSERNCIPPDSKCFHPTEGNDNCGFKDMKCSVPVTASNFCRGLVGTIGNEDSVMHSTCVDGDFGTTMMDAQFFGFGCSGDFPVKFLNRPQTRYGETKRSSFIGYDSNEDDFYDDDGGDDEVDDSDDEDDGNNNKQENVLSNKTNNHDLGKAIVLKSVPDTRGDMAMPSDKLNVTYSYTQARVDKVLDTSKSRLEGENDEKCSIDTTLKSDLINPIIPQNMDVIKGRSDMEIRIKKDGGDDGDASDNDDKRDDAILARKENLEEEVRIKGYINKYLRKLGTHDSISSIARARGNLAPVQSARRSPESIISNHGGPITITLSKESKQKLRVCTVHPIASQSISPSGLGMGLNLDLDLQAPSPRSIRHSRSVHSKSSKVMATSCRHESHMLENNEIQERRSIAQSDAGYQYYQGLLETGGEQLGTPKQSENENGGRGDILPLTSKQKNTASMEAENTVSIKDFTTQSENRNSIKSNETKTQIDVGDKERIGKGISCEFTSPSREKEGIQSNSTDRGKEYIGAALASMGHIHSEAIKLAQNNTVSVENQLMSMGDTDSNSREYQEIPDLTEASKTIASNGNAQGIDDAQDKNTAIAGESIIKTSSAVSPAMPLSQTKSRETKSFFMTLVTKESADEKKHKSNSGHNENPEQQQHQQQSQQQQQQQQQPQERREKQPQQMHHYDVHLQHSSESEIDSESPTFTTSLTCSSSTMVDNSNDLFLPESKKGQGNIGNGNASRSHKKKGGKKIASAQKCVRFNEEVQYSSGMYNWVGEDEVGPDCHFNDDEVDGDTYSI